MSRGNIKKYKILARLAGEDELEIIYPEISWLSKGLHLFEQVSV